MSTLVSRPCCKSVWQVTSLVFPVCVTNLYSRQCDKFSFRVCVQILFSPLCDKLSFLVCASDLVFSSVWQMLCIWLCAEVLSGSVWPIYFSFSRVLWSVLSLKIWFTWRVTWRDESVWQVCVANVMNASLCRFCPIGVCVTNLLSILACLRLVFFLALRMEIWLVSACVTILCTLWSAAMYKCYECIIGHHVRVPCAWSSFFVFFCFCFFN